VRGWYFDEGVINDLPSWRWDLIAKSTTDDLPSMSRWNIRIPFRCEPKINWLSLPGLSNISHLHPISLFTLTRQIWRVLYSATKGSSMQYEFIAFILSSYHNSSTRPAFFSLSIHAEPGDSTRILAPYCPIQHNPNKKVCFRDQ
jgi:hypothetical protein